MKNVSRKGVLAACICFAASPTLATDALILDGLTPGGSAHASLPVCVNTPYEQSNCVRVLACLGIDGAYFDGQAHGWDTGIVIGFLNDDTACEGEWVSGGPNVPGRASFLCENGVEGNVLYHTLDNETGTVIGSGTDSLGRDVTVWSGENVLQFLTGPNDDTPILPCGPAPIPIS